MANKNVSVVSGKTLDKKNAVCPMLNAIISQLAAIAVTFQSNVPFVMYNRMSCDAFECDSFL